MDFLERMKNEYEELNNKILKLEKFVESKKFENLNDKNKSLLKEQHKFMKKYSEVLLKRIEINKNE